MFPIYEWVCISSNSPPNYITPIKKLKQYVRYIFFLSFETVPPRFQLVLRVCKRNARWEGQMFVK